MHQRDPGVIILNHFPTQKIKIYHNATVYRATAVKWWHNIKKQCTAHNKPEYCNAADITPLKPWYYTIIRNNTLVFNLLSNLGLSRLTSWHHWVWWWCVGRLQPESSPSLCVSCCRCPARLQRASLCNLYPLTHRHRHKHYCNDKQLNAHNSIYLLYCMFISNSDISIVVCLRKKNGCCHFHIH